VRNNAVINTQTSNTITSGNVIINRPAGSGNTLNVVASAVVGQNLFVSNLIVSRSATIPAGSIDLSSVSFTDLTVGGTSNVAALTNTNTLIVRSWMYQQGANARFDGAVDFTNTSVYSVNARGNIFTSNNFQTTRNVICENITVNSVANVVTLRIGTIEPRVVTGTITFNSNVSVAADKITQLQGNVRITGNTELGPYTESLFDFGVSVGTNQNLNLRTGSAFRINLSSSVRLTVINPPPAGRMAMATLFIRSGTAGATPTLAGNTAAGAAGTLRYAYDAAPVFDTGLNKTSVVTMTTIDGGVNWFVSAPILGATSTT
jgi:hypothetical protein